MYKQRFKSNCVKQTENKIIKMLYNTNTNLIINSPLEQFEITSLLGLNAPIFGYLNITLTNLGFYSLFVLNLIIGIHYMGNNETKLLPNKWSIGLESIFASVNAMVREQLGKEIYLPFIYSLFFFILIANLTGNVPYSYTVTTSIIVTIGLSFTILTGVPILALVPLLVLIETVSYLARAFSLGIRLFANMVAGHTLLKILSTFLYQMFSSSIIVAVLTFIPFSIFLALIGLELAVSLIQSYVFTLLVCSYIKDAILLH